jgi:hypothetical protein
VPGWLDSAQTSKSTHSTSFRKKAAPPNTTIFSLDGRLLAFLSVANGQDILAKPFYSNEA